MSSVSVANHILRMNQKQEKRDFRSRERQQNGVYQNEQHDSQLPKMHRQPINFGDESSLMKKDYRGYGPTTREAVKPDRNSYFRQNENINTIKGKKPKVDPNKPINGERTAANDVINEYRWKYLNQEPVKRETKNEFKSRCPPTSRNTPAQQTSQPINFEQNEFSFISNDFKEPEMNRRPKEKKRNKNVIQERGNAIPINEVLNSYKSTRTYKDAQHKETNSAPKVPKMSREAIEKEKKRNEELNARLRGFVYQPQKQQRQQQQQEQQQQRQQQQQQRQQQEHIYQSIRHYNKSPSNAKENELDSESSQWNQAQTRYTRKPNKPSLDYEEAPVNFTISQEADELARSINSNSSPLLPEKTKPETNHYVLSEAADKSFDISEVLHGYKSKHVYKNTENSSKPTNNPAELAKQKFDEKNAIPRTSDRERVRLGKLKLYSQQDRIEFERQQAQSNKPRFEKSHMSNGDTEGQLTREQQIESVMHSDDTRFLQHLHQNNISQKEEETQMQNYDNSNDQHLFQPMEVEHDYTQRVDTSGYQNNDLNVNGNVGDSMTDGRIHEAQMTLDDDIDGVMNVENTPFHHDLHNASKIQTGETQNGYNYEFHTSKVNSGKTPEPKFEPKEQFKDGSNQLRTIYYHDREGKTHVNDAKPDQHDHQTSQNTEENLSNDFSASWPITNNTTKEDDMPLPRRSSSRSNPNVTFGKKDGNDIVAHYNEQFELINSHEITNPKSKSESTLFGADVPSSKTKITDMNRLNFTNISSNLRRFQRHYDENSRFRAPSPSNEIGTVNDEDSDHYLSVLENNKMVKPSQHGSGRSHSTVSSYSSIKSSIKSARIGKDGITVTLPGKWSADIVSSNNSAPSHVNDVVGNTKSADDHVQHAERKEDALSSLTSLDRRLQSESRMNHIEDDVSWMTQDIDSPRKDPNLYRESGQPITGLTNLNKKIRESGYKEGQDMRVTFYESLQKITALTNQLVDSIPKHHFPFKITPTSYQGDFEKKGPFKIDLYLNIENLREYDNKVRFLIKNNLAAYIILNGENREKLKHYCARNRTSSEWVLSASRIMMVFSYLINTEVRPFFEQGSPRKRKDIVGDAEIKFVVVSETLVRFHVSFPGRNDAYNVGLMLAFNVNEFPSIIEKNRNRKWPDTETRTKFTKGGVHLVAQPGLIKNHAWAVSFLKTRKILLNVSDEHQTATNILLALQVINKTAVSKRECSGLLLPVHFIMILFWVHETYREQEDWMQERMSQRFLDVLITLKRCLEKKLCPDFFFPKLNYFESISEENVFYLLQNVKDVLKDPSAYL